MPLKPYIRKLEDLGEIAVWEVNGKYVRDNISREFTNFGQHYRFSFIPTFEFWLDKEYSPGEMRYFVDHLLIEWRLMREGMPYKQALEKADAQEKAERAKSGLIDKVKSELTIQPHIVPKEVYKKKLEGFGDVDVWVVNGEVVRSLYFIDFTEGGHHFVYDFVPLKEVWLDNDLSTQERDFILLHELHERYLMSTGMEYDPAHRSSSIIEYKCRQNSGLLKKALKEEVEKNNPIMLLYGRGL